MVDGPEGAAKTGKTDEAFKKELDDAAAELLKASGKSSVVELGGHLPAPEEIKYEIERQKSYEGALKTEFDAEAQWNRIFKNSQKSIRKSGLDEKLKEPGLDAQSKGYLQYLQDNFPSLAGITSRKSEKSPALSLNDLTAFAAMNEVSPKKIESGIQFLKDNFFKVSGTDDKVTGERVERLLFDHSYLLFPKDTQERLDDLYQAMKSVDLRPQNYEQGKRLRTGINAEEAAKLDPAELSDNLRIQALQKGIFGRQTVKLDKKSMSADAGKQYEEARARFLELKKNGIERFLSD